jgi:hypothetical protein
MNRRFLLLGLGLPSCAAQAPGDRAVAPQPFAARVTSDSAIFNYPMADGMLPSVAAPSADPRFGIAWIAIWKTPSVPRSRCEEGCALSFLTTEALGPETGLRQLGRLLSHGEGRFDVWIPGSGEVALGREPALVAQQQPWGVRLALPPSPALTELLAARPDSVEMQLVVGPADTSYSTRVRVEYPR